MVAAWRKDGGRLFCYHKYTTETALPGDLDLLVPSISLWDFDTVQSGHVAALSFWTVTLKQRPSCPHSCLPCNGYKWPGHLQKEMFYTYMGTSSGNLLRIPDCKKIMGKAFIYFSVALRLQNQKKSFSKI